MISQGLAPGARVVTRRGGGGAEDDDDDDDDDDSLARQPNLAQHT